MDEITYAYAADIVKTETTPNGDMYVYGKAAGPEVDMDKQICDPAWLSKAMPDWYEFGNVRAQHSAVAAGIGKVLDDTGSGTWMLKSLVVDRDSKEKVDKKVYKGYSIGIKNARVIRDAKAPKGRIVDGDIVEISLVDRPSNPTSVFSICKAAGGTLAPVDMAGEVLYRGYMSMDVVEKVLTGDLIKSLQTMAPEDASELAAETVAELCDRIVDEAEMLKAAVAEGEPAPVGDLWKSIAALRPFVDMDESEPYPGFGDDVAAQLEVLAEADRRFELRKAAGAGGGSDTSANLQAAEITKAVAKVTFLEGELATLREQVAKAPRSGGPVLMTQPVMATATKSAEADRLIAIADRIPDPDLATAYRQAAEKAREVAA